MKVPRPLLRDRKHSLKKPVATAATPRRYGQLCNRVFKTVARVRRAFAIGESANWRVGELVQSLHIVNQPLPERTT